MLRSIAWRQSDRSGRRSAGLAPHGPRASGTDRDVDEARGASARGLGSEPRERCGHGGRGSRLRSLPRLPARRRSPEPMTASTCSKRACGAALAVRRPAPPHLTAAGRHLLGPEAARLIARPPGARQRTPSRSSGACRFRRARLQRHSPSKTVRSANDTHPRRRAPADARPVTAPRRRASPCRTARSNEHQQRPCPSSSHHHRRAARRRASQWSHRPGRVGRARSPNPDLLPAREGRSRSAFGDSRDGPVGGRPRPA
jgi:hypothetical protein